MVAVPHSVSDGPGAGVLWLILSPGRLRVGANAVPVLVGGKDPLEG